MTNSPNINDQIELAGKRVLVTGAASMIGRAVCNILKQRQADVSGIFHQSHDLMNDLDVKKAFAWFAPDYVIHAAGFNGNIGFNKQFPADIFYRTTKMGINVLNACVDYRVKKVVSILTSCAYRSTEEPLKENTFLDGQPDQSVEAHGFSKRTLFMFSKQLAKQHNLTAVGCIFNTAFGPFDNFDIDKTKVVGSLIKKFVEAKKQNLEKVECWGTGNSRRELIYCDDAAEGVVQVLEKYHDINEPINIGFNEDISIKELASKISKLTGFEGKTEWNLSKPDGQMRKILDCNKMKQYGIEIRKTGLDSGLLRTIAWLKNNGK